MISLFDQLPIAFNTNVSLPDAEFPSLKWVAIPSGGAFGEIKFEPREVETQRLSNCFDIRLFENQKDTKPPEDNIIGLAVQER